MKMITVEKYCWFHKQCKNFNAIDNLQTSICKNYIKKEKYPYCENYKKEEIEIDKNTIEIAEELNKKLMTPKKYNCKIYCKKANGPVCIYFEIGDNKIYCKHEYKKEICAIKIKDANDYIKLELIPHESFCRKCFYNDRYEEIIDSGLLKVKYDDEEIRFYDEDGQLHNDEDKPAKIKQDLEVYFNHGQFIKTIIKNKSLKNCIKRWKCKNIKPGLDCHCDNLKFCNQDVGDNLPEGKDCLNFEKNDFSKFMDQDSGFNNIIKFPDCDEYWDASGNIIKTILHPSRYKCDKWKNCKNFETSHDYYYEYQEFRSCKNSMVEINPEGKDNFLCYKEKNIKLKEIVEEFNQKVKDKNSEDVKKLQELIEKNSKKQDKYAHLSKSQLIDMIENKQEQDKIKIVKKIILNFKRNIEEE